ncbi:unnamed protein product [Ambrosiozyma monospora]|uniref:Unnamed protein product n=1 Tax=Ambrosiozyma monospora TaxID=43982 RepID=A0ACB5T6D7_AMBMO|nr:unnamed protein product [Ambrosiozyma monospora]
MLTSLLENFLPLSTSANPTTTTGSSSNANTRRTSQPRVDDTGLAVVGMLHSYDGEFKQFGLFTPIDNVLDRLEEVTGISWGVVGCATEDDDESNDGYEDEDEEDEDDVESDLNVDYESGGSSID